MTPHLAQYELVKYCLSQDIRPVGYSPLARVGGTTKDKWDHLLPEGWPDPRDDPYLQELATKYGKTVCQVMLNWGVARGHVVIPKAERFDH